MDYIDTGVNYYNYVHNDKPAGVVNYTRYDEPKNKFSGAFRIYQGFGGILAKKDVYITKVIYSNPATIVIWSDGSKTVSKVSDGDTYSKEAGLALCVAKKLTSPTKMHDLFADWLPEEGNIVTLKDVKKKHK